MVGALGGELDQLRGSDLRLWAVQARRPLSSGCVKSECWKILRI